MMAEADAMTDIPPHHIPAVVVGGGQAGLSMSWHLQQRVIEHVVFEKHTAMHVWRTQRWDSFCLVTPNWQCLLPGHPYAGSDSHGFMVKDEIVEYLGGFAKAVNAPLREGVGVLRVAPREAGGFDVATTGGAYTADAIVVASGGYHRPIIPRMAEKLPKSVMQVHSAEYRGPSQLPDGAVLVVGSGQSGAQIAEDLHLAGRKVHLAVGNAPRCGRFYRGRDVVTWLADMGYYEMPVDRHPLKEGVRDNTNHYVTGRDGGRDIDLRKFALEGMELYGVLAEFDDGQLLFREGLRNSLDEADRVYNGINASIDKYIKENGIEAPPPSAYTPVWQPAEERLSLSLSHADIVAVIWCIGFEPDFRWLDVPVFSGTGHPKHQRGVAPYAGVYFLGLPWLHTWGSGRFSSVGRDAEYLADRIKSQLPGSATPHAPLD
jgi:putative flavoprotein involved in K+ transport